MKRPSLVDNEREMGDSIECLNSGTKRIRLNSGDDGRLENDPPNPLYVLNNLEATEATSTNVKQSVRRLFISTRQPPQPLSEYEHMNHLLHSVHMNSRLRMQLEQQQQQQQPPPGQPHLPRYSNPHTEHYHHSTPSAYHEMNHVLGCIHKSRSYHKH